MATIYTHSSLEAVVCEARYLDTRKMRYGKAGPARQGQAGHRLLERYTAHLFETKQEHDFGVGLAIWDELRPFLTAGDEADLVDDAERLITGWLFPWVATAKRYQAERVVFVEVPSGRRMTAEEVAQHSGPVFRATLDASWEGVAPDGSGKEGEHILDWKFHRQIEHVTEPAMNRQLLRYAATLHRETGCFGWVGYPRRGYFEGAEFSPRQLEDAWNIYIVRLIEELERRIPNDPPDRTVGTHCKVCDLRPDCEAALRYPFEPTVFETINKQETLVALALIEKLRDEYLAKVKDYVVKGGDYTAGIPGSKLAARLVDSEAMVLKRPALERVLLPIVGQPVIDDMLTATKTTIMEALTKAKLKPEARRQAIDNLRSLADKRQVSTKIHVAKDREKRAKQAEVEDGEFWDEA